MRLNANLLTIFHLNRHVHDGNIDSNFRIFFWVRILENRPWLVGDHKELLASLRLRGEVAKLIYKFVDSMVYGCFMVVLSI